MKRTTSFAVTLLIGFLLIVFQAPAVSYGGTPEAYVSTGLPQVVVVSGTNYEMGVQYGEQAAAAINHNLALFKSRLYEAFGKETVTNDMAIWDYYIKKYDPSLVDWFKGISAGVKKKKYTIPYLDLVLLTVYPSEMWAHPTTDAYPKEAAKTAKLKAALKKQLKTLAEGGTIVPEADATEKMTFHSCNAFSATGAATADGKPIIGVTQMVGAQAMDTIILLAFPTNGASWIAQPYAGRVNSNAAMNSNGFAWTMTAIFMDEPIWGLTTEAYFHYLAQHVTSPAEAVAYLKSTPRAGVAGSFILNDAAGNSSVFESNAATYVIRDAGDEGETGPFVVTTNHLVDPSIQSYNPSWNVPGTGSWLRYDTVFQFITESLGSVDFSFAKGMFASDDWYDATNKVWHRNEPGAAGVSNSHGSINQSIFFPADLTAYLQTGTPSGNGLPAYTTGEYVKIQLATDPNAITAQAAEDALSLYWDANDLFEYDLNAGASYLTYSIAESIRELLDTAFVAYSLGMDREAYADLEEKSVKTKVALYGEALSYYAKAQLYSQLVTTQLTKLKAGITP